MRGEENYAALGLRPGAGRAEVDEAYRRLIKRYHPDRTGGDGGRAAEINRAYTQLTRNLPAPAPQRRPMPVPVQPAEPRSRGGGGWVLAALLVTVAGATTLFGEQRGGFRNAEHSTSLPWSASAAPDPRSVSQPLTDFGEPLQGPVIDRAIADAIRFHEADDAESTIAYSRSCHDRLRSDPSLAWFDSCAAFDEAIVTLSGHEGLAGSAAFNPAEVVTRQMTAARLLSGDLLVADSRLNQIRSRVELELIPRLDAAAAIQQPQQL